MGKPLQYRYQRNESFSTDKHFHWPAWRPGVEKYYKTGEIGFISIRHRLFGIICISPPNLKTLHNSMVRYEFL